MNIAGKKKSASKTSNRGRRVKNCVAHTPPNAKLPVANFYASKNEMHTDGYLPICKECIKNACYDDLTDIIDVDRFKTILMQCDRPFIQEVLDAAEQRYIKFCQNNPKSRRDRSRIIGYYFTILNSLHQYREKTWMDGLTIQEQASKLRRPENSGAFVGGQVTKLGEEEQPIYKPLPEDFVITEEMLQLFGEGHTPSEYRMMWEKYLFLKQSYPDVTNFHIEALVTYIRFKTKEEAATSIGDVNEAEKWSRMAREAADRAKINPSQLRRGDLQGGLNSFSELFQAVEQAVDVIPILPKFKFRPNDAIDFNIWCLINYLRDLEGKPLCSYEDVYKFYDERKAEYIAQYGDPYGIFTEDPTEKNRESIQKFITMPRDYYDEEAGDTQ